MVAYVIYAIFSWRITRFCNFGDFTRKTFCNFGEMTGKRFCFILKHSMYYLVSYHIKSCVLLGISTFVILRIIWKIGIFYNAFY